MALKTISTEEAIRASPEALFEELESSPRGLSASEARRRVEAFGPNALEERRRGLVWQFLGYLWGPIPWMIEVAAILSLVVRHWADLTIIFALLVFNAGIGFWQEYQAGNAVEALKRKLALHCRVRRDGQWQESEARVLVPGDVIRIRLGDVIPADVKLFEGRYLSIDQSALTGESLPVEKKMGDVAYSGSIARQGEMVALVTGTGTNTYIGRTAKLVTMAKAVSHFQRAVLHIGDYLIVMSLGLAVALVIVQLARGAHPLDLVQFALILVVASIPVAMPAVLSVTMAVGALALSKMKAIVSRLESIEEMAGMDILCADKTGTLTENQLTLGEPVIVGASDSQKLILAGALASKAENRDPIDLAVIAGLKDRQALNSYRQERFEPFDPVRKRTEAKICRNGDCFEVSKGAPQVILALCPQDADIEARVMQAVGELALRGFRTLGVARRDEAGRWTFLGLLPLFDPPRPDSAATIAEARAHGISVKMVTGDNLAIGREISAKLGLGQDIVPASAIFTGKAPDEAAQAQEIERAGGFAEVFPEHKYRIVKALQSRGHIVGMTGDGANDAPALKQAEVGIAVSGATDAARAAASLVLTAPGLTVIVGAIEEARRIFERMNSYAIYRITETIRIMFFVVLAMIGFNFYPITAIMIILLAFFNDIPIMAIAKDDTWLDPNPVRWDMRRILTISTLLGLVGVVSSFGILILAREVLKLDQAHIQTFIFLKLAVAGHLTLFVARTRRPFWTRPFPAPILLWSAIATKLAATLFVVYPLGLIAPLSWRETGYIWAYALAWFVILDLAKVQAYRHLALEAPHHRRFLEQATEPLTPGTLPKGRHG